MNTDLFNTVLLDSNEEVDQINKKFYGRFNYPWPPLMIPVYPESLAPSFMNQDLGYWNGERVPAKPRIWVAGCGTNQALLTALKFPLAEVYATDISTQSLAVCRRNAEQIGVTNLHLEEKSLNSIEYEDEFDYIICTGVVHHNARPGATLAKIARALKKNGVLEFMVYNYFHRIVTVACQKAIRNFYDSESGLNLELELNLIKNLMNDFHYDNLMASLLRSQKELHEAEMTDNLIQPVEYSYTVESLNKLGESCGLEMLFHCQNQFDVNSNAYTWNMKFESKYMSEQYYSLPDIARWQISNMLLFNNSPMLWFYFQRKGSDFTRKTEHQLCDEFMETKFQKSPFFITHYILGADGKYVKSDKQVKYPAEKGISDPAIRQMLANVTPGRKMKDILHQLNTGRDFYEVNMARIKLTTSGYPFLLADG